MTTDRLIMGCDLSTLEDVEADGGRFFDGGKEGLCDDILISHGYSSVRLRVWNDPYDRSGKPYGGGTCDTEKMIRTAVRLKNKGMSFMLDLHYSDFWCDPARQGTPKAWQDMNLDEMCSALGEFTERTVSAFMSAGAAPEYVQVGNEITNGMLWDTAKLDRSTPEAFEESFARLAKLLKSGCEAVRRVSDAKIILHLEQSGRNAMWREWFDEAVKHGIDFDIIGASYYPLWHGSLATMKANLDDMVSRYGKDVMIVETAYPFTDRHFDPNSRQLMINDSFTPDDGSKPAWSFTPEGQAQYLRDLVGTAKTIGGGRCLGIYWWEPAWIPTPNSTWATREALADIGEEEKDTGNEWANQCLFDYDGNALPALDI
ncbi:arabinogalactan endo-1,4-beta-galactosidase [Ruminococcus sp. YE71]|uniref:glycoside hydrolase family 53 protein n=1 Tax=unclassified Ruminococcus TaxID=2608920 RepID=UPI0008849531|nr:MULTISPECIES: glycosyl hydrolase 53 family protein [unclassified Ruminococcus]SDA12146.1 arabinogalactan endo-1,4-beta-galactosidase [Ruminococcus sp. YE78]SFW16402.1 arabinogalactan endo-1,4-beta-galactosidase [Ruminococcus sp. YE71]